MMVKNITYVTGNDFLLVETRSHGLKKHHLSTISPTEEDVQKVVEKEYSTLSKKYHLNGHIKCAYFYQAVKACVENKKLAAQIAHVQSIPTDHAF